MAIAECCPTGAYEVAKSGGSISLENIAIVDASIWNQIDFSSHGPVIISIDSGTTQVASFKRIVGTEKSATSLRWALFTFWKRGRFAKFRPLSDGPDFPIAEALNMLGGGNSGVLDFQSNAVLEVDALWRDVSTLTIYHGPFESVIGSIQHVSTVAGGDCQNESKKTNDNSPSGYRRFMVFWFLMGCGLLAGIAGLGRKTSRKDHR